MGLVWKATKMILMSLAGTNCKHVKEDVKLIGLGKMSISSSREMRVWRNGAQ
jgi:hypothetical protein